MTPSLEAEGRLLGVFAKQPIVGQAKTRIAQELGAEFALRLARAMLEDTLDRLARVNADRAVAFTPDSEVDYFSALTRGRFTVIPQANGDLGDRLRQFFQHARRSAYTKIVVVGTDSPTLPIEFIDLAFDRLSTHDAAIGPTCDGGYYLIGCGVKELPIFTDMPWSTDRVFAETRRRLEDASIQTAYLPGWYDIDTANDWKNTCRHVLEMRRAGIDPGVPRLAQMILETPL